MPSIPLALFIRRLRRLVDREGDRLSDECLLERFVTQRDEAAFELLVWRHGPMVLNVCRRVLRNEHDAEDAFQAAFLAMARKAGTVSRRESLAGWLYQVAYRAALRLRRDAAKRTKREHASLTALGATPSRDRPRDDVASVLDEEVSRLPRRYRVPFVLCYLEGKTNIEVSQQLGCPLGTVASRLSWARQRLRDRLSRRGIGLSTGLSVAALSETTALGTVPAQLVNLTVKGAVGFAAGSAAVAGEVPAHLISCAKGVLNTMYWTKLKIATVVVLALGLAGAGAGLAFHQAVADERSAAAPTGNGSNPETLQSEVREPVKSKDNPEKLDQARDELAKATNQLANLERQWTDQIVEARVELSQLEERKRSLDRRLAIQEDAARTEFNNALVDRRKAEGEEDAKGTERASRRYEDATRHWEDVEKERATWFNSFKAPQIKAEENFKLLERKQSFEREQYRMRLEAAEERVRNLEGISGGNPDVAQRRLAELDKKVNALSRDLAEVLREVKRQRPEK
ncbi:MAG TPA: sigma-70 family RNA polymerase sigma factor [Gemmataceae bacterium]